MHPAIKAAGYLREHYAERLTTKSISMLVGCSDRHLQRLFRNVYGCSMRAWLRCLRLVRAKGMISEGTKLQAVAAAVGLVTTQGLIRGVRRRYGIRPKDWRVQLTDMGPGRCPRHTTGPLCEFFEEAGHGR